MTRPSPGARQYQTHRQLLARTSARLPASLDAIIVPASRPAVNLDHAVTLARAVRCQLVVLCSGKAHATEVNELLASRNFNQGVVVDLPDGYTHPKLDFVTSGAASLDCPEICVNPNNDLSVKRNLGLLLARMLGWQRIFFLDDDIRDLDSSDLHEAASMLGPYHAVGMRAVDFPDNSVVCHGHRETGAYQDVFISGSALAVHCAEPVAFFPEIYNEDWFFFYHAAAARRLGQPGRDATQLCYDPFADPQRAAGQEFGDIMAEGLYSLLHYRIGTDHATSDYWQIFLDSRMRFLEAVLARTEEIEPYLGKRIASSVESAMDCTQQIKPPACEKYIALWKQDLEAWEQRLKDIPRLPSVTAALRALDLRPSGPSAYVLAGIIGGSSGGASKDFPAGEVLIPSSLPPGVAEGIKSIVAPRGAGVITNGDGGLSFGPDFPPEEHRGDEPVRGAIGRMSRRASEIIRRALVAEARSEPEDISRNRDSGRLAAGRHRRPPELVPVGVPRNTDNACARPSALSG